MTAWLAVLGVGIGSYAFRWLPLALAGRRALPAAVEVRLRHASLAAVVALAVGPLRSPTLTGTPDDALATSAALLAGAAAVRARRPMVVVVLAGLGARWLVLTLS